MKSTKKRTGMIIGIACAVLAVAVLIGSMGATAPSGVQTNNFSPSVRGGGLFNWSTLTTRNTFDALGRDPEANGDAVYTTSDGRVNIGNASVSLQTKTYDACTAAIKAKLKELEGRCDAYDEQNYQSGRQATIIARVPGKKLDAFLDSLGASAAVVSKTVSFSDVTDTLIDTESKKKALEAERDALLKLIDQATNVDEVMRVQQRLSQVRGELEGYLKTLQSLKSQVEYSTVEIFVSEVDSISTPSQKFGDLAGTGFLSSIKRIGAGVRNFALWLIAAIPYLALLAVPAAVGALLLRRAAKRRRAKSQAKAAIQA